MNPLRRLHTEQQQSPWLDDLTRDQLADGELRRLVDRGIRGLTSDPSTFARAVAGTPRYDSQIAELVLAGADLDEAYWAMAVNDVQAALAVLRPLHDLERILSPDVFPSAGPVAPRAADGAGGRVMREWKRTLSTALARHVVNPIMRAALDRGIAPRGYALLETTGRTSGLPRRPRSGTEPTATPSGWSPSTAAAPPTCATSRPIPGGRSRPAGDGGRVRPSLLPDDDPRQRQRTMGRRFNAAVVRRVGTDLLSVRIDLDQTTIGTRAPSSRCTGEERPSVPGGPQSDVASTVAQHTTTIHRTSVPPSTDGARGGRST